MNRSDLSHLPELHLWAAKDGSADDRQHHRGRLQAEADIPPDRSPAMAGTAGSGCTGTSFRELIRADVKAGTASEG